LNDGYLQKGDLCVPDLSADGCFVLPAEVILLKVLRHLPVLKKQFPIAIELFEGR